jgi:very-short-patch-repair endonuclease
MIKCKICEKKCTTIRGLSFHIKIHKISSKEYYDKFLKEEGEGICLECGKETRFIGLGKGYHVHCSYACVGTSDKIKKKTKQTFLKKYGVENPMRLDVLRNKQKQTCLENHGVENPSQSNIVKEKKKQTCLKHHGVENPSQSAEILEKKRQTSLNNYGVSNPNKSKTVREKIKQTNIEKYGVVNPFQSELVKDKIKQININKYGTEYLIQAHIINFDKWNDKDFNEKCFLTEERYVKVRKMMEFFNISESTCYQHLTKIGIEHKSRNGTSSYEQEIYDFLRHELGILNIIQNDRQLIKPHELDFLLPDYKLAIEFDGIFWHSEQQGKDINYHLNKTIACESKGVWLIHVFENEWVQKRDIIKSILKAKLGRLKKLCGARQTIIREIIPRESSTFLNKNHRQGSFSSSLKLGAFYKKELVAVMTFFKPSIAKGRKDNKSITEFELSRFATTLNHNIPGMASKFLAYFKNNYLFDSLLTFADRRYSDGTFYKKLGFNLMNTTRPCYWYFKNGSIDLKHRFKFRKSELNRLLDSFNPNLTEYQNMIENGFGRIFDCGNYRFVLKTKPIS